MLSFIYGFDKMLLTLGRWLGVKCNQLASSKAVVFCGGIGEKQLKKAAISDHVPPKEKSVGHV